MKVFYHEGQRIRYYSAGMEEDPCLLCWEPMKWKALVVKDKGVKAHFRCAYPDAYAKRRSWVEQNAQPRQVTRKRDKNVRRRKVG